MSRFDVRSSHERAADAVRVGISQALRILDGPMGDDDHDDSPAAIAAKSFGASSRVVTALRRKAAVDPMTTVTHDPLAHARLADGISDDFIDSLRTLDILDAASAAMIRIDSQTAVRVAAATASGTLVSQGAPKPLQALSFGLTAPPMRKEIAICVIDDTVLRGRNAERILGTVLRGGVARGSGAALLTELQGGVTPITASGTTAEHFRADLAAALALIRIGAASRIYAAVSPQLMARLALIDPAAFPELTVHGGSVGGVEFVPDDSIAEDTAGSTITVFDASRVAFADEGVDVRASREATIQFDDTPNSSPTASTIAQSLFQTNRIAILAERYFGVELVSNDAVATISNALYGVS